MGVWYPIAFACSPSSWSLVSARISFTFAFFGTSSTAWWPYVVPSSMFALSLPTLLQIRSPFAYVLTVLTCCPFIILWPIQVQSNIDRVLIILNSANSLVDSMIRIWVRWWHCFCLNFNVRLDLEPHILLRLSSTTITTPTPLVYICCPPIHPICLHRCTPYCFVEQVILRCYFSGWAVHHLRWTSDITLLARYSYISTSVTLPLQVLRLI
jgi:hypothetical protein